MIFWVTMNEEKDAIRQQSIEEKEVPLAMF